MPPDPRPFPCALCPDCLYEVFGLLADLNVIAADVSAVLSNDECPPWDDIVGAIRKTLARAQTIAEHVAENEEDHSDED